MAHPTSLPTYRYMTKFKTMGLPVEAVGINIDYKKPTVFKPVRKRLLAKNVLVKPVIKKRVVKKAK